MEGPTFDSLRHIVAEVRGDRAAKALTISELAKLNEAGYTSSFRLESATHSDLLGTGLSLAIARALLPAEGEALSVEASYGCNNLQVIEQLRAHRTLESAQVDS